MTGNTRCRDESDAHARLSFKESTTRGWRDVRLASRRRRVTRLERHDSRVEEASPKPTTHPNN